MIKEEKVLVKINPRNINHFIKKGYDVSLSNKELLVNVYDLSYGSKVKVTAICSNCRKEKSIEYSKYITNKKRSSKDIYSCFSCKNIKKEETCIKKYGVKSYSMTDEFKTNESIKWKGIRKGDDKYRKTMIERYGVDCYYKTDIMKQRNREWMSSNNFKLKSKETLLERYGVDSYSKTEMFKKIILENKDLMLDKMRKTLLEKYGVDSYFKLDEFKQKIKDNREEVVKSIKKTCLDRYGYDNVSKVKHIKYKTKKTKIELGYIIPDELLTEWEIYRKDVRNITKKYKKELFEKWDGNDYYDNEFIKGYLSYSHIHRYYPSIDHKISIYYGFINNIPADKIGNISNLCITKRYINSIKKSTIDSEFVL